MADTVLTKKITDLPEGTEINDEDLVMTGVNGTASLRKNKWSKFVEKLRNVLFANNLTTTQAGYGLDARQGKALKDEIDKINTKINSKIEAGSFSFGSLSGKLKYQNGYGDVTINLAKQGYKALGLIGYTISSSYLAPSIVSFDTSTQKASITARHVSDNSASGEVSVYVSVLYVKE